MQILEVRIRSGNRVETNYVTQNPHVIIVHNIVTKKIDYVCNFEGITDVGLWIINYMCNF